jgi:hypothetical protein
MDHHLSLILWRKLSFRNVSHAVEDFWWLSPGNHWIGRYNEIVKTLPSCLIQESTLFATLSDRKIEIFHKQAERLEKTSVIVMGSIVKEVLMKI